MLCRTFIFTQFKHVRGLVSAVLACACEADRGAKLGHGGASAARTFVEFEHIELSFKYTSLS